MKSLPPRILSRPEMIDYDDVVIIDEIKLGKCMVKEEEPVDVEEIQEIDPSI